MKGYSRTFRSLISFGMAMLMLIGCLGSICFCVIMISRNSASIYSEKRYRIEKEG